LLAVARALSSDPMASEAALRRAVSTAYYAVFHTVVRAAASRFVGASGQHAASYAIVYRSFEHSRIREVCAALEAPTLKAVYQRRLSPRIAMSQSVRDFAEIFQDLQDKRHEADYSPIFPVAVLDVRTIMEAAEVAMSAFDQIAPDEKAEVLALMMVKTRA